MIILITGASHTGKTALAQKLLEKYQYPYLSIDHLKMGLIRSGNTELTPLSDDRDLTAYLWPIIREMIKTAIENKQNLVVEGCYIPFDWQKDFDNEYLENIKKYDPPYLFVGDGVPAYTKVISEALGDKAVFADAAGYVISAAAAAVLAEKMTDKAVSHFDLEPYYLRVSSAQREYEERQAKLGNKQ